MDLHPSTLLFCLAPTVACALACAVAEPAAGEPTVSAPSLEPSRAAEDSRAPAATPRPAVDGAADLEWSLRVEPSTFALSDLERVRVVLEVRNAGAETVNPLAARPGDLRIDGEPSMALSLAFGNGLTGPRWSSLPPGESVTDTRVGVVFVDTGGKHLISAHRGDASVANVTVTVRD